MKQKVFQKIIRIRESLVGSTKDDRWRDDRLRLEQDRRARGEVGISLYCQETQNGVRFACPAKTDR